MAKPLKIFLWIVTGLVSLVAVAAIAVVLLFNPNGYKGRISGAVKANTGRDLAINGNIKMTLLPWLGASVSDVTLSNAEGFGPEPFAHVGDMTVGIKLMPLILGHKLEVATIHVDGLALNLAKNKDGKTNWEDLSKDGKAGEQPAANESNVEVRGQTDLKDFVIGGLDIKNVAFSYVDQQADKSTRLSDLSVHTGEIRLDQPIDVAIAFLVSTTNPQLDSDVKLAFTANPDVRNKVYEIKDLKLDTTTKGPTVPGGSQKASMTAHAVYDGGKGTFALTDAVLKAASLELNATVNGENLSGDTPKLSGKIATNTFNPKEVAKSFGIVLPPTSDPSALTQASFATNLAGTPKAAKLDSLTIKLDQTTATGTVAIDDVAKQSIEFALKADAFNADRYLAPAGEGAKDGGDKGGGDFKKTEIPVEALDSLNAHGTITLDSLTAKGLKMTGIRIVINALKGQPKTEEMTALLYGGKITQSVKFSHASPVHYDFNVGLDAVNASPLLKDMAGKTFLSGLGNFQLKASSGGTTVGAVLESLTGSLAGSFKNGAIEGFNLDQTLGAAKAMLAGQAAPAATGPNRTEFKDLAAAGDILNGIVNMKSLDMKGSGYQVGGTGKINLVNQTLDYTLLPTVSGDKYKELAGTKIPVQITGSWTDPKVKLDLAGLVKGRANQEIEKQKEKAKERFGDFLRKKLGPQQPEQKPAQPAAQPAEQPAAQPAEQPAAPPAEQPAEQPKAETPPAQ